MSFWCELENSFESGHFYKIFTCLKYLELLFKKYLCTDQMGYTLKVNNMGKKRSLVSFN